MDLVCQSCGAPAKPNLVVCEFCEKPISAEAARSAVPCPKCQALNAGGQQQCHKCQSWLVVQCVFCSHLSAYTAPACQQCNEPFAGAQERKARYDSQQRNQQIMQTVGMVAPVAGALLGGVAGALLGERVAQGGGYQGGYGQGGYGQGGFGQGGYAGGYQQNFGSPGAPDYDPQTRAHHEPQHGGDRYMGRGSDLDPGEQMRRDAEAERGRGASYFGDQTRGESREETSRGASYFDDSSRDDSRGSSEADDSRGSSRDDSRGSSDDDDSRGSSDDDA